MNTQELLLPISQRRSGLKNDGIRYIVCHDTGNSGSTAKGNVEYYIRSANEIQASAHYFVDHKEVVGCIPEDEKAWHVRYNAGIAPNTAGNYANDHALGIELCYGFNIDTHKSYDNYCSHIASLLKKYNLTVNDLVAHSTLDPTRRTDPQNAFHTIGKTWETFLVDISQKLQVLEPTMNVTKETPQTVQIKKITVTYDKTIEGVLENEGVAADVTVTDELVAALKLPDCGFVEPEFNIELTK